MSRPTPVDGDGGVGGRTTMSSNNTLLQAESAIVPGLGSEKPVCSGNGVSCSIILAEPTVFLVGFDHDGSTRGSSSRPAALVRGKLQLNVTKSAKIKAVTLRFTGIPPSKSENYEEESFRTQGIPFFNAMYEGSETGYGTCCTYALKSASASSSVTSLSSTAFDRPASPAPLGFTLPVIGNRSKNKELSAKEKRLSLQNNQSRSFQKGDSPYGATPQQKGYKVFHPGVYEYAFELSLDNNSPETTKLPYASITWMLEVIVERAGTFKANLQGFKEIPVVRLPSEDSLELIEPIAISRKWDDQLFYEIIISGKSFPLGSKIPMAFKLTPLAKVQVHKIKIILSENVEYYAKNKSVTRKDSTNKITLVEKAAGKPLAKEYANSEVIIVSGGERSPDERSRAREIAKKWREREAKKTGTEPQPLPDATENMLGDIDIGLEDYWTQTELEMNVQLPTCEMMEKDRSKRLAHDCTWRNSTVHHWMKIILRISRIDPEDPSGKKRRHFEITIDSPLTILNCRATQANISLPEYPGFNAGAQGQQHRVCGCPNAALSNPSPTSSTGNAPAVRNIETAASGHMPTRPESATPNLTRPAQAHFSTTAASGVQRPIHLLRSPSYGPPAFDAEQPPPPLPTPPPHYDYIVGTPSHDGLADYFARLGEEYDDHTDDEDINRAASRGRVNVANPRTPGGRVARSMDIDRNFMFNSTPFETHTGPINDIESSSSAQ
ncbi:hypothetical protein B7494_g1434 [Chlorociboria aeruginascens]|nr:hypothetical protein B7494_g1434 [Chlorociboria aeruginascens]